MQPEDLTPDCHRIRGELAGLVYDELAPDTRTAVEQHLLACVACRDELAALRDTQRLLARWETPPASEDPRVLARSVAAAARPVRALPRGRERWVRWSAVLAGAAAAFLFTLSVLDAHASFADGRFELSFGAAPAARPDAGLVSAPGAWRDEMRAIAAQEVASRTASLEQSQEVYAQMTREELLQELLRLSQAVDYAMAQHQESWDTRLTSLGREAARADLETRRALTEFASYLPAPKR